ncbi:MAG: ATP-binding protein [Patescibacteria group bacterium]|jgi:PAS domain S-box-containing protein
MKLQRKNLVDRLFRPNRKNIAARLGIFGLTLLPIAILAAVNYVQLYDHLTQRALDRRQAVAQLAGQMVQQHFDALIQVGRSLASRPVLIEAIEKNDWPGAIETIERTPEQFPFIKRIALNDLSGTARANFPRTTEGIGTSFAYRDWYQGVSKNWTPYVSEVFQRAVEPKTNVVGVAVPIVTLDNRNVGILLMQVELDTLLQWTSEVSVGGSGYIYVVDRKGHVMIHPEHPAGQDIVDLSSLPAVQQALESSSGVGIFSNPQENEDRLYAYWTSPQYGFSVGVQEPVRSAFATRREVLTGILFVYAIIFLLNFILAWVLWRLVRTLVTNYQQEDIYLTSIGDGVVAIDRDWNITLWNDAAAKLTGWSAEEAIGGSFREKIRFLREHDRKENIGFVEEAILFGTTKQMSNSTILLTRDEREIPVSNSAAPIFGPKGQVSGVIIIFRDDTHERDSHILRTDFAYASHQLRTPITKALWSLEAAAEGAKNGQKEKLETARIALLDVQKLSERLLEVSLIDQKTLFAKPETVSVADTVEKAVATCSSDASSRTTRVVTHFGSAAETIETDPKLLRLALEEVISNAVLYSPKNSTVDVQTAKQGNELLIEVRDTGLGIPEEQQTLVFTKFFRGENVPSDVSGVGLGLFIAREYIRLLGGRIWFVSEPGRGTTFSITIPISKTR